MSQVSSRTLRKYQQKFGVTPDLYQEILESAKTSCEICGSKKHLCLDHNHVTHKVRGILCQTCNKALGAFKDDREILQKAINYLHSKGSYHDRQDR